MVVRAATQHSLCSSCDLLGGLYRLLLHSPHPPPPQISLHGREGKHSNLAGVYHLAAERENGYPSYTKVEWGETSFLYHAGDGTGRWLVTDA